MALPAKNLSDGESNQLLENVEDHCLTVVFQEQEWFIVLA